MAQVLPYDTSSLWKSVKLSYPNAFGLILVLTAEPEIWVFAFIAD